MTLRSALISVAIALLLSACNSSHTLHGTITAPCSGGYNIENAAVTYAAVTVRNEKGEIIGTGTTGGQGLADLAGLCTVSFKLEVSPAKLYTITIGTHEVPTYSNDEMERQKFNLDLNLK